VVTLLSVVVAAAALAPASQGVPLAGYCSPSEDICYGAMRLDDGRTELHVSAIKRYFRRYTLCVTPPRSMTRCRQFPLVRIGRIYGSRVILETAFSARPPGVYRATWKLDRRLGPTLRFRRR
jgi:hypothetical protein